VFGKILLFIVRHPASEISSCLTRTASKHFKCANLRSYYYFFYLLLGSPFYQTSLQPDNDQSNSGMTPPIGRSSDSDPTVIYLFRLQSNRIQERLIIL
jgi:hypothetical protein